MGMNEQEFKCRIAALERENSALKAEIRQSMTAGLIEAFAYESSHFDLERSDFQLLTGIKFHSNCFFTLFLRERRVSSRLLQFDANTMAVTEQPACSFSDMKTVISSAFHPRHTLLITPSHGHILTIVNFLLLPDDTGSAALKELEFTAKEINLQMQNVYGFSFDIFISGAHFGTSDVCKATRDCELVRDYSLLLDSNGEPQILCYPWFQQVGYSGSESSITTETLDFGRHINNQNYAEARRILNDSILPRLQNERSRSLMLRLEYQRLTDFFIRTVLEGSNLPQETIRFSVESLLRVDTYAELAEQMNRILQEMERRFSLRKSRNQVTAEQIHDYVSRFFSDSELDVAGIAEHFHISSSYASRIHRTLYGETVLMWLQTCRLISADELLRGGASVRESAEKSGFGTAANFIRIYKKYYGTTPGNGRQQAKSKIDDLSSI